MARLIPGAGELILPNVSHFALLQDPTQFKLKPCCTFFRAPSDALIGTRSKMHDKSGATSELPVIRGKSCKGQKTRSFLTMFTRLL
jgi:hypothetical protein